MATYEWKGTHEGQLRRALRVRHLVMLAVGGTIASGFLLFAGSGIYSNVMEITPPLIMTQAEVDEGVAILDQAIGEVEAGEVSDEVLGDYAGW
jgi:L-asparagine transporter-like permease